MCSAFCIVLLSVCLIELGCTASGDTQGDNNNNKVQTSEGTGEAILTTITTAASKQLSVQAPKLENATENDQSRAEESEETQKEDAKDDSLAQRKKLVNGTSPKEGKPESDDKLEGAQSGKESAEREEAEETVAAPPAAAKTSTPGVTQITGEESSQPITTSGTETEGKKEKQDPPVPSQTTDTTQKKEEQSDTTPATHSGEKETIQKHKPKDTTTTTAEPTTSTGAPNTTLSKGFKITQSVDKTDGSSRSTTLLFLFATVVSLTVISVAPVY